MCQSPPLTQLVNNIQAQFEIFENEFPLASLQATNFAQKPFATLLCCSDSRMPPEVFGQTFNRIFCIENIGNQVLNNQGSIMYGLLHLHTPLMLIVGHTDCGAIKAAVSDYSAEPAPIQKELDTVKQSLRKGLANHPMEETIDSSLRYAKMAELNVDIQIDELLAQPEVKQLTEEKNLLIIGMMLDLHNVYGNGYGKIYTCNMNGEIDVNRLAGHPNIGALSQTIKRLG